MPIRAATAKIELPPGAAGVRAIAFNGVYGSTARDAAVTIDGNSVRIVMPHPLEYHEGLTAVVGWNKGVVTPPGLLVRTLGTMRSNWPLLIPLPVLLFAFARWRRSGVDPRQRPITVQYDPPHGMTPAEAGTLLDNSADMRDITATLVDLAVRGYMRIEEQQNPKLFGLFGGGTAFTLCRLKTADGLAPHERVVFDGIFGLHGDHVQLDELKDEFYKQLSPIRDAVFTQLTGSGFYQRRPDKVKQIWMGCGIGAAILIGVGGVFVAASFLLTPVPFVIAAIVSGIILLIFAQIMPARTEAGTRALEQVLGFEEFLRRVESEHL